MECSGDTFELEKRFRRFEEIVREIIANNRRFEKKRYGKSRARGTGGNREMVCGDGKTE